MMAGMNRVFSYENSAPNPLLQTKQLPIKVTIRVTACILWRNDFATNGNDGRPCCKMHVEFWYRWRLGYIMMIMVESELI
jgi:hypothetical protein